MPYYKPSASDPNPWLYAIVCGATLRDIQTEHGFPPAALLLLVAVDTMGKESGVNPTAAELCTGWLSAGLLRRYVCDLERQGYIQRLPPRRRAARRLLLTGKGFALSTHVKRELRGAARKLVPLPGRWPAKF
ncbi:hypothetical protein GCM10022408_37520 [Hymenobacter fastidiosus]|uniref:MarR family transcriptional regulator n=1 Tax=Hymenobacter fastidiosus TaxID=486264 RepID=A0ABP7T1W5_9BACT